MVGSGRPAPWRGPQSGRSRLSRRSVGGARMTLVFTEIMEKIDKAARNGTKLHLPINLVRALATSDAYATLAALKAKERSEEHTSELQSLMRTSYAVFCLKKKKKTNIE